MQSQEIEHPEIRSRSELGRATVLQVAYFLYLPREVKQKIRFYKSTPNTREPVGPSLPPSGSTVTPTPTYCSSGCGDQMVAVV